MRIFPSKACWLLPLLAAACEQHGRPVVIASPASMHQLEGTWLLSAEECRGDTLVYRPNTYGFPPVPGRPGFVIGEFGRFEQLDPAPAGGLSGRRGTWTLASEDHLRIHLADGPGPDYTLEVLALRKPARVLRLRKQP